MACHCTLILVEEPTIEHADSTSDGANSSDGESGASSWAFYRNNILYFLQRLSQLDFLMSCFLFRRGANMYPVYLSDPCRNRIIYILEKLMMTVRSV